ncbi:MAG: hypothetical protein RBT60_06625 [Candidatus Krumholzibacteria bacterium]|nr:hypothetical protein [Candidatus Krumholzibacteria bacterium]
MLRSCLTLVGACSLALVLAGLAAEPAAGGAPQDEPTVAEPVKRDAWYWRGFDRLFARRDPGEDTAAGAITQSAYDRFLPYAGWTIRRVAIRGREAFGSVDIDFAPDSPEPPPGPPVTKMSAVERVLNSLAAATKPRTIENYLLFRPGDRLSPRAVADSERLLRERAYVRDARLMVTPVQERPGEVDIIVWVRDRWPWGVRTSVRSAKSQQIEVFHRNIGGIGLGLEVELLADSDRSPSAGWRTRTAMVNLGGSFVDLALDTRYAWDRDQMLLTAERRFSHAEIRALGGWAVGTELFKALPELPAGVHVRSHTHEGWLGWSHRLRRGGTHGQQRWRFIPAVGVQEVLFSAVPGQSSAVGDALRDNTRYLGQLSIVGTEYYTAGLVYGYGETEDLPAGLWASLVGGYETSEGRNRAYHGVRAAWPQVLAHGRYVFLEGLFGGYRRSGRLEDGVLEFGLTTFSPLQRHRQGAWRHFLHARYTLGLGRLAPGSLRLDSAALRDLDAFDLVGDQRLVADLESIWFTPVEIIGFKFAVFGYAGGGLIAPDREPLLRQRLETNGGLGLRLNNPSLVIPTIELRAGILAGEHGWDSVVTLRMGEVKFLRRTLPGARPALLPYR